MLKILSMVSLLVLVVVLSHIVAPESVNADVDVRSDQLASIGGECIDESTFHATVGVGNMDHEMIGQSGPEAKVCRLVKKCYWVREWWDGLPIVRQICEYYVKCS